MVDLFHKAYPDANIETFPVADSSPDLFADEDYKTKYIEPIIPGSRFHSCTEHQITIVEAADRAIARKREQRLSMVLNL